MTQEIFNIWKSAHIPTIDFGYIKKEVIKVIKRGTKPVSKKTQKTSPGQGYHIGLKNCFIISKCRCFTKAQNKNDIGKLISESVLLHLHKYNITK